MITTVYDASIEAGRVVNNCRERINSSYRGKNPSIDIYTMSDSSRLFLNSIRRYCETLGIVAYVHGLGDAADISGLSDELIDVKNSGSSGVLFIRPPYDSESYNNVLLVLKVIRDTLLPNMNIDREDYSPIDEKYPHVVEATRMMIEAYQDSNENYDLKSMKAVVIGSSPFVGKPITMMSSDIFDQVVQLHQSTDSRIINKCVKDANVIITYRSLDDIEVNHESFIIDVGNDNSYKFFNGKVSSITTHLGKLTTALLLSEAVDNYCNG